MRPQINRRTTDTAVTWRRKASVGFRSRQRLLELSDYRPSSKFARLLVLLLRTSGTRFRDGFLTLNHRVHMVDKRSVFRITVYHRAAGKVAIRPDFGCPQRGKCLSCRIGIVPAGESGYPDGLGLSPQGKVVIRQDSGCPRWRTAVVGADRSYSCRYI